MESLQDLLNQEPLKDFRQALVDAQKVPREYQKSSDNVYKPEHARFKLVIYFKDGNTRYYYSYDNKTVDKKRIVDELEGFKKLLRLIHKYKGKFKNAYIYATLDPKKVTNSNYNCEIYKCNMYGIVKYHPYVNIVTVGVDNVLDSPRLKNNLKIQE